MSLRALSLTILLAAFPAAAAEIRIGGSVTLPGGAGPAEAEVVLVPLLSAAARARAMFEETTVEPVARGRADADGRFVVAAPHPGLWTVRIQAEGFVPLELALEPLIESVELPEAELVTDSGMTVTVTGPKGAALAGATVISRIDQARWFGKESNWSIPPRAGKTGADGKVRLPRGDSERVIVSASYPGLLHAERGGNSGSAARLALEPGLARRVQVRSSTGQPIPGVMLAVGERLHPLGLTDEAGLLELRLDAARPISAFLLAADGRQLESRLDAQAWDVDRPDAPRTMVLEDRSAVSGKLIDAQSRRPIAAGFVWDARNAADGFVTDEYGGFVVAGPANARVELAGAAPGYLRSDPIDLQLADDGRPGPTLPLAPATAIEGKVVDAEGQPVVGATIGLEVQRAESGRMQIEFGRPALTPRAVSGPTGGFRLGPVDPEQNYLVKVDAPGFAPGEAIVSGLEPYRSRTGVRVELDRGQGVIGRVVDAEGGPLRDAAVVLKPHQPQSGRGMMQMMGAEAAPVEFSGTSDGEGRFKIVGLRAGKYDLEARRAGFAPREIAAVEVGGEGATASAPTDVGEIQLEPGQRLQGLVTDRSGLPLEGVEVFVVPAGPLMAMVMAGPHESSPEPDAVTGPDGWFRVEDLAASASFTLRCQRTGFVQATVKGLELPRTEPVQVKLEAASDVSGTVVREDGEAVAGARVMLRRTKTMEMAGNVMAFVMVMDEAADADGRFLFADQEPGTVSLSAVASGYQEAELANIDLPKGEDVSGLTLKLPAGAIVHGRVLAPDGRPAIGAEVRPVTGESKMIRFGGARTDGNGYYRVEGLASGPISIEATHEDYPRAVRDIELKAGLQQLDLQLEGGHEVSGMVATLDGTAVAGATVNLAPVGRRWGGAETRSGSDGTFVVPGVRAGTYELWVEAVGFAPASGEKQVEVVDQPVHGIEVRLDPGVTVFGRIGGIEPERLGGVRVSAEGAGYGGFESEVVDSQGNYRIEHLAPGSYEIVAEVSDSGRAAKAKVALDQGAGEVRADIQFEKGLVLSGRVVQADSPVVGSMVIVEGLDVDRSGWDETGSAGEFRIEGLDKGRYKVGVRDFEFGLAHSETLDLATGREIELELPSGEVQGFVRDASDRRPVAGVALTLEPVDEELRSRLPPHTSTTDLEGRFRIRGIAAGEWKLAAAKAGYSAVSRSVAVRRSGTSDPVEIVIDPTEGMTLETALPSGAAPDEIRVAVVDTVGEPMVWGVYATGEKGRVRLSTVPAGTWAVVVSAAGSATMSLEATAPGAPVPVALEPPTSLRVTVPELQTSGQVATVRLNDANGRPFRGLEWSGRPVSEWRMVGGLLEFASLPPRQWVVTVSAADGRNWEGRSATSASAKNELVLD